MGQHLIDEQTADRLLSGVLAPEDAPPGFGDVARFLQAARTPPAPQELARCADTVAAMAGAIVTANTTVPVPSVRTRRRAGLSRLLRPRIAATLAAGALALLWGGLAEAGALPGPLQHAAHVVLSEVGLSVPDAGAGSLVVVSGQSGASLLPSTPPGHGHRSNTPASHGPGHGRGGRQGPSHGRGHGKGGASVHHHGRPASPGESTGHSRAGSHPTPTAHPTTPAIGRSKLGPRGLCNAWKRGQGGQHGQKMSASSFQQLKSMAAAHSESIAEFCAPYLHSGQAQGRGHGKGPSNGGTNRGRTTAPDRARGHQHR